MFVSTTVESSDVLISFVDRLEEQAGTPVDVVALRHVLAEQREDVQFLLVLDVQVEVDVVALTPGRGSESTVAEPVVSDVLVK